MPTYVSLIHWTDQGIKNYKDSPSRAADFTKLAESSDGRSSSRSEGRRASAQSPRCRQRARCRPQPIRATQEWDVGCW